MMKVLFTHGYFLHEDPKEQAIMKPYPPLGLLYLSAWLDKHGMENEVFDTTFSTKAQLKEHLLHTQPAIVALYTNLMTKLNVIEIVSFIRSQETLQNTLIVLGGPDVTHNIPEYLGAGGDLIVIGEGEQTMLSIAECGMRSAEWGAHSTAGPTFRTPHSEFRNVNGLAYLMEDGSVHKTGVREKLRDIDTLPFPSRHKIDLGKYLSAWKNAHGHSAVSISTQRGCPYTCKWCSTAVYGQSYRRRSAENVVDEIVFLQKNYDFDLVWFVDDVFTVSHKWLGEFHDELKKRQVTLQFECITRADRLNDAVLKMLRDCGCFRVWIGAESGSQRIIDAMDRRVDVGQVRAMIKAARREGIQAGTFIMLGYPGETEADIQETVAHLKDSNPDLFTITVAYPIKGTGLYEEVQTTAITDLPWAESTDRDIDFPRTYPRRYYDFAVRWTVNSVHWHKAKLAGKQFSINGLKLWGKVAVARVGMAWHRH
jgi:anaerobic magnesium-protoporphyrin IX monomethyl ester cyclase